MDTSEIMNILLPRVQEFKDTAINFAKSRFVVAADEFGSNSEERAELDSIAESISVEIFSDGGNSVGMNIKYGHSPYLDIIQNGMPAPLSGGDGGMVTEPDGSQRPSLVPEQLQGQTLPEYSKTGKDVMGEVATMMQDLFKAAVQEAVSNSKQDIGNYISKTYLIPQLQSAMGGGK